MDNMDARDKRTLAIVIAALLILLGLATWGGIRLGASSAANQAQDQKAKLESATAQLSQSQVASATLQTQLESVQASFSQALSRIETFQRDNAALRTQLVSGETELSKVQSQYGSLQDSNAVLRTQLASAQADNAALQAQVTSLKSNYDSLMTRYRALENTKPFTVDSRLTVRLSTEAQLPTVAWVRGEVMNIGNASIRKVYILVSRYNSDGSLNTLDLPPTVLLNLASASVGYFSFLSSGETCKVTLLGDY